LFVPYITKLFPDKQQECDLPVYGGNEVSQETSVSTPTPTTVASPDPAGLGRTSENKFNFPPTTKQEEINTSQEDCDTPTKPTSDGKKNAQTAHIMQHFAPQSRNLLRNHETFCAITKPFAQSRNFLRNHTYSTANYAFAQSHNRTSMCMNKINETRLKITLA
jgi:hypothetical protein